MANKSSFKAGHKGGPGRPKLTARAKKLRKITQTEAYDLIAKFIMLTRYQLKAVLTDPESTILDCMIGRICLEAANKGNTYNTSWVYDRLWGKVADKVEADITTTIQVTPANAADLYNIARRAQVIELAGDDVAD